MKRKYLRIKTAQIQPDMLRVMGYTDVPETPQPRYPSRRYSQHRFSDATHTYFLHQGYYTNSVYDSWIARYRSFLQPAGTGPLDLRVVTLDN